MIDTIKVAIPLTKTQHTQIYSTVQAQNHKQWVLFDFETGSLEFVRVRGLFNADQESFHRQIRFDLDAKSIPGETYLIIELSLPKLWYGHNIHLLYDFTQALQLLRERLNDEFNLKTKRQLPSIEDWEVWRLDPCYAWRFPSQPAAQTYLDSLKHLHYPRKKPHISEHGIMFSGKTYSIKFYLKLPEFRKHDLVKLKKDGISLEWINHLEKKAEGVLRYEATLRKQYLKRQANILTVADLLEPRILYEQLGEWPPEEDAISLLAQALLLNEIPNYLFIRPKDVTKYFCTNIDDSKILPLPHVHSFLIWAEHILYQAGVEDFSDVSPFANLSSYATDLFTQASEKGVSLKVTKKDKLVLILSYFLSKFLGSDPKMQDFDVVSQKLESIYKPVKAARLASFWLYVQRAGSQRAKEKFGKDSFYDSKADLKKAGISLIEPPSNVIEKDKEFWQSFKPQVPSPHATNTVDDYRNSDNLLNLFRQKLSEPPNAG